MTTAWAIAWMAGVALLIGGLAAVNAIVEYRRLKKLGVPKPLYVLWQRTGAHLAPGRAASGKLEGRLAWIAWDVRWVTFGESTARVVSSGHGNDVFLHLDSPGVVRAAGSNRETRLETVRFVPWHADARYGQAAVSGRLEPEIQPGLYATAVMIIYPPGVDAEKPSHDLRSR